MKKYKKHIQYLLKGTTNPKTITWGILLLLIITLPAIVLLTQQKQETRQHANTTNQTPIPAAVCANVPADIVLIIDRSDSMKQQNKLTDAISAATQFVTLVSQNTKNRISLVSFAPTASLDVSMTTNYASVKTALNGLQTRTAFGTCTDCGEQTALKNIADHANDTGFTNNKKVIIMLTDGLANWLPGGTKIVPSSQAETAAITDIKKPPVFPQFTIGLGTGTQINPQFLQNIGTITGAKYYNAPTGADLQQIYQQISQIIGKGSISGFVFNDQNNNSIFDTSELKLPGWNIHLEVGTSSATPIDSMTTDSSGGYSFTGLCDGIYYATEDVQSGWTQTLPNNPTYYQVSITNGNTVVDTNFGNIQRACGTICSTDTNCNGASNGCAVCNTSTHKCSVPSITPTNTPTPTNSPTPSATMTPTPTPNNLCGKTCTSNSDCQGNGSTCQLCDVNGTHKCTGIISPTPQPTGPEQVTFDVGLHGIGDGGDNPNPHSLGNMNPLHKDRPITLSFFDTTNQLIGSFSGTITFRDQSKLFFALMDIGSIPDGNYIIKAAVPGYLQRRFSPGVEQIKKGYANQLQPIYLITGDVNSDNQLDLLDYNLIIGCYSSDPTIFPPKACTPDQKLITDITDDGNVNGDDYNQFLRELSVQVGD